MSEFHHAKKLRRLGKHGVEGNRTGLKIIYNCGVRAALLWFKLLSLLWAVGGCD